MDSTTDPRTPLSSFEVEGYRGIRHLRLPELGRVTLFVGKNDAGKTSLLEALRIYLSRIPAGELIQIVREHGGLRPGLGSLATGAEISAEELRWAVDASRRLLSGSFEDKPADEIRFRRMEGADRGLSIRFSSPVADEDDLLSGLYRPDSPLLRLARNGDEVALTVDDLLRSAAAPPARGEPGFVYVPSSGFDAYQLFSLWRDTVAAGDAERMEAVLRRVIPSLTRVVVLDYELYLQLVDVPRPVPLEGLGEGTHRAFGFSLALIRARGGAVIIDEVENGLHYSVQHDIWDLLFDLAEEQDVQIFATTHSWETVVAFQYSANRSSAKGMLYRLERKPDGRSRVERYTEKDVAIAAEQEIEVR